MSKGFATSSLVYFTSLLQLFNKHYLGLFFLGMFIRHPSWQVFWYIIGGVLASQFLINIRTQFSSYLSIVKMYESKLKHWLEQRKKGDQSIAVKRYSLSEYLGVDNTDELFKIFFISRYHRMMFGSSDAGVRVYDIKNAGVNSESGKVRVLADLTCFARPVGITYAFVKIAPNEIRGVFDKLKICHEIGHYVVSPIFLRYRRNGGILMVMILIFLTCICIDIHAMPLFFIIAYGCLLLIIGIKWFFAWLPNLFRDEVYADLFSLYCLSDDERKLLAEKFSTGKYRHYFDNPKMLRVHIEKRESIFMANLEAAVEGGREAIYVNTIDAIEPSNTYVFLRAIFWFLFFSSIGFFSKKNLPFSSSQLWYTVLWFLLSFSVLVFINNRSEKEADNALGYFTID